MVEIAKAYLGGPDALHSIAELPLHSQLANFLGQLRTDPPPHGLDKLTQLADQLATPDQQAALAGVRQRLIDNFVALFIAPDRDRPSLVELADLLRVGALLQRIVARDTTLDACDAVPAALSMTLALPSFFKVPAGRVRPVGIADLLVVKQHVSRYELGEVARIENVLKGETRKHTQRHTLVNEKDTTVETETTKQTEQELTTTDKVDLKNEVDSTLKEDFNLKAGVQLALHGTGYDFKTNFDTAYDRSSSQASKFAADIAKDVTRRASTKITERVRQVQTTKITETFDELEDQGFENKDGGDHISGVYQWVEKVYQAQVFNYGKHLLFDLMVPEPAAFVLAAAAHPSTQDTPPVAPPELTVSPLDLTDDPHSPTFYGKYVAQYQVTGVEPPPPATITVAKAIATSEPNDGADILASETIQLDDGYIAKTFSLDAAWYHRPHADHQTELTVLVGSKAVHFNGDSGTYWDEDHQYSIKDLEAGGERGELVVSLKTAFVSRAAINVEVACTSTDELMARWKLETYEKIAARYQKLKSDYDDKVAARQFQETAPGLLGRDPETNRLIERAELKKSCISILVGYALPGTDDITDGTMPPSPAVNVPAALADGPFVRFFEQAFEWDKIGYVFYPYYWGRSTTWLGKLNLTNTDPLFESFLKAGYARVVLPVRLGFEDAIQYFLITDQIWQGGALPSVTDPTYLPITEEIKEQTNAPDGGVPVGDPWEFRLPTQLIKLRPDDQLPQWTRQGNYPPPPADPWTWTPV
jgi:hypothetical protein